MSEYKRLTKRKKDGSIVLNYFRHDFAPSDLIAHRLAELEDKIKAGTLVTVPYTIGQELYCVSLLCKDIEKVKVSLITIRHDGSVDIRLNHYNDDGSYRSCFKYDTKYYELFDNEVEAKKRLEEIKNETNTL